MEKIDSKPLVSVLMPCYNHQAFVAEAIESVLAQTYPNIELIVIDDGSTDGTWEEVERLRAKGEFIALSRANKGLIETIKELRAMAHGEYIGILASDDRYYPDKIEAMVKCFQEHPSAGLCVAHTDKIDEQGNVLGQIAGEYDGKGRLFDLLLWGRVNVSYVATLVRADAYRQVEFINDYVEDLPAWLQISRDWPVVALEKVVASHRQVAGSVSSNLRKMIRACQMIISHFSGGKRPYPLGWCERWLGAYMMISMREALEFLLSKDCTFKVLLTTYFYKALMLATWLFLKRVVTNSGKHKVHNNI